MGSVGGLAAFSRRAGGQVPRQDEHTYSITYIRVNKTNEIVEHGGERTKLMKLWNERIESRNDIMEL